MGILDLGFSSFVALDLDLPLPCSLSSCSPDSSWAGSFAAALPLGLDSLGCCTDSKDSLDFCTGSVEVLDFCVGSVKVLDFCVGSVKI